MRAWPQLPQRQSPPRSGRCPAAGSHVTRRMRATLRMCPARRIAAARRLPAPGSPPSSTSGSPIAHLGCRRQSVAERKAFQYTVLRVVPDVERGERVNVGVVLYSPERRFLGARVALNAERLRALAPELDVEALDRYLGSLVAIADGDADGGPLAQLPQSERFGALSAPSSTIVQPSEVHTGVCEDGGNELDDLFRRLVLS